jgi:N-acetylglucosamine-6-sulfatase
MMRSTRTFPLLPVAALVLATAIVTAVVGTVLARGAEAADAAQGEKPNIILVVTDDQRLDELNQRVMPATNHLIADEGTVFTGAMVTTPLCCPSRATMLTGQYGHNHGVLANAPGYRALEDPANTLPLWLKRAGYRTAHLGKFLNGYNNVADPDTEVAPGWDEWYTLLTPRKYYGYSLSVNGQQEWYGNKDSDHLTRVLNRRTARLIRRFSSKNDPFYIQLDHLAPHTESERSSGPSRCKGRAVPDSRDNELIERWTLPRGPSFNEPDVSDKPSFIAGRPQLDVGARNRLKKRVSCRLASLRAVDRGMEKIVKTLKQEGVLNETVIIFISDNGYFQGEHRIGFNKTVPYEEALRVPLAVRVPLDVLGGERPSVVEKPVANLDLAPTILDLAGAEPCNEQGCRVMDGRSLAGLLTGNGAGFPNDRAFVVEYGRANEKDGLPCEYRGIHEPRHMYMEYTSLATNGSCTPIEEGELYDLTADPFQLDNMFQPNGLQGSVQARLEAKLRKQQDCAGIAGRDPQPAEGSYCE